MRVFVTAKPPPRRRAAPRWLCVAALALAVLWALQDALQPQAAALLVAGMSSYAFAWYRDKGRLDLDSVVGQIVEMALKMVKKSV